MTTDFGAELRRLRQERRLSIRQLAAEIPLGKSHVHDLETGRRGPTPAIAQRLDETLDARGRLVALRRSPGSTDDDEPNLSGLVNVALVGVVEPRPLNHADAVRVRATTAHLVALDTLHGSDGLLPFAVRAFHAVADQVAVVDGSAEVRSAVADLGAAAAWIAADAVKRDESRALGLEALALADLAGDVRLHRFLLSHLSMVSEHGGRYADALAYAERLLAEDHDDPRVHAMVEVRRARAFSGLGRSAEALIAWHHADVLLGESPTSDDGLTYWIHDAEMSVHKAIILSRSGDRTALDWVHRSIELLPDGQGRDQVLWRAILLEEAVVAGAWAEIPEIAVDLERFRGRPSSARVPEVLARSWRRLSTTRAPLAARDAAHGAMEAFRSWSAR